MGAFTVSPTATNKKPSNPAKSENEGSTEIPSRTREPGWPHPSLRGEVGPAKRDHDERNQTGILTSGSNLAPAFPPVHAVHETMQWLMGVRRPLQWRNRSGFSPDSLTFSCDKDELAFTVFKEHLLLEPIPPNAKKFLNSSGEKFSEPWMDSDGFGLVRVGSREKVKREM